MLAEIVGTLLNILAIQSVWERVVLMVKVLIKVLIYEANETTTLYEPSKTFILSLDREHRPHPGTH